VTALYPAADSDAVRFEHRNRAVLTDGAETICPTLVRQAFCA
jgi:hypothetical protein